ncbi:hypothetical protein J2T57_000210 [Natronocella acetinitrilica]|jgi:hypothetical protein|uniref:DUF4124 domain-containing protein n=1 Tax=Natronocella acetinitrilica TaxID=414046 RepID=A0AAE3G0Y9_9GAMM|nr:DUF4124 domain-containing protein [Natronocella acetinitrilica]MCP1673118.1 hypothetical protein [Natronocella acetinitrilica]
MLRLTALLLVCLIVLMGPVQSAEAQLYRWVDDDGNVHYTDRLPPERARDGRRVYSPSGIAQEDIDAAPTEEQRQALIEERRRQEEQAAAERQAREEQAAFDRFLLRTYSSSDHILRVQESRLETLDRSRTLIETRLERDHGELEQLRGRAAEAERGGSAEDLDGLYARIQRVESRIRDRQRELDNMDDEEDRLMTEFGRHLDRYQELQAEMNRD